MEKMSRGMKDDPFTAKRLFRFLRMESHLCWKMRQGRLFASSNRRIRQQCEVDFKKLGGKGIDGDVVKMISDGLMLNIK